MSKDIVNWNLLMENNIDECLNIVKNFDFKQLQLSNDIENFLLNISCNHNCDPKVLFFTILSGIGHFGDLINVYNIETKQTKPISVYEILIAPSGVEKSKYINIVSNTCSKIDFYLYENHYKKQQSFTTAGVDQPNEENEKIKNNKSFDCWVNEYGSVKQVYTTPSLIQMMINTSIYFLANEGDAILQESSFYSPADVTADIKQGTLTDCWDGNKIIKSTVTHGSLQINNRTVSICVASTGRRWPDLLRELSKVQIAGGLHERCSYFCFDINDESDFTELSPTAEQTFYSNLYDNLLSSNSNNDQSNYALVHIFFIVKLFDHRIFVWSKESFSILQPRLHELKTNKPCKLISNTVLFRTKQQMAMRRRSAEHVVRYACLIQMFINALDVLKSMDNQVVKSSGGTITKSFELEAKATIIDIFGAALSRKESFYENGVPVQPLKVNKEAATSAVQLVFSLLLPQSVWLYNYEPIIENKSNEQTLYNDLNTVTTKQEKTILQIEKFVMKLNFKFFHKSCITDHHFRDKRSLVNDVLTDLMNRQLVHQAPVDKPFFSTGRASAIKTYLKFIPSIEDEQRFCDKLLSLYNIQYEEYKNDFKNSLLAPPNCTLTPYACDFIRQSQYDLLINKNDNNNSNQLIAAINPVGLHPLLNSPAASSGNHDHELEQSKNDPNNTDQHSLISNFENFNQNGTTVDKYLANRNDVEMDFDGHRERNLFPATTRDTSKEANDYASEAIFSSNADKYEKLLKVQNRDARVQFDNPLIYVAGNRLVSVTDNHLVHVTGNNSTHVAEIGLAHDDGDNILVDVVNDDLSTSLLSTNEEDIATQTQRKISEIIKESCNTNAIEEPNESVILNENEKKKQVITNCCMNIKKQIYRKILLIPSVILTKASISPHIKLDKNEMKEVLNYLVQNEFLISGKYLQCTKRKIEAYLKYVPENLEDPTDRYLLQERLLNVDVNIDEYIQSLKSIQLLTSSYPSDLLIKTLQEIPYAQLNIDFLIKHPDASGKEKRDHDKQSTNYEKLGRGNRRKKIKINNEDE